MAEITISRIDAHAVLSIATVTRDALPYTEEFDSLFDGHAPAEFTKHEFWRALSNGAKRGGLKGKSRGAKAPKLSHSQADTLRTLLAGRFSRRDELPYSEDFDYVVEQFNARCRTTFSHQEIWRAVCNLAKQPLLNEMGLLFKQAIDSLVLGIEHFNRPSEDCRKVSTLLMLDHAFEMLLKSALCQRGVELRNRASGYSIGINECLNKATDDGEVRFLSTDERRTIAVLNGLRDQAQHYLVDLSEQILYTVAQTSVTLFAEVLARTLGHRLCDFIPSRVLPISTDPPKEMHVLMRDEYSQLREILDSSSKGDGIDEPRIRSLATIDRALQLNDPHLSDEELSGLRETIRTTDEWFDVFSGIAQTKLSSTGEGPKVAIYLTKKDGVPVRYVSGEDAADGAPVIIRRVDDTETYCFSPSDIAKKLKITGPKLCALVRHLYLKNDPKCFKEIKISRSRFDRYSAQALEMCRESLKTVNMDEVWAKHRPQPRKPR